MIGGYVGAHLGRRIPPILFRVLVVIVGVIATVTLVR